MFLKLGKFSLFVYTLLLQSLLLVAGDTDISFGYNGMATQGAVGESDAASSVAIQSDGKIIVAGSGDPSYTFVFAVMRYNADGTLDSSFGTDGDGVVETEIGFHGDIANSVAIQSDGKIVVAGKSGYNGTDSNFAVVRYNTDGTLDSSFSSDGMLTTDTGGNNEAHSVAIQSDGKIVVAGGSHHGGNYDFTIVRYNTNGTLDSSFSSDGIVTTDVGENDDWVNGVAIQSDGKIVAAGARNGPVSGLDFAVVRYNTNGTLDSSFSSDGIVTTDVGGNDGWANGVAIQSDGKIVVAGRSHNGNNLDFAVVRYNTNGTLDSSFSPDGVIITDICSKNEEGHGVAIQSDGKIVVAGTLNNGIDNDIAVARYNTNGMLDSSFSSDGIIITDRGNRSNELGHDIVIQGDGKIIVVGSTYWVDMSGPMSDFLTVRYNRDGSGAFKISPIYYLLLP